MFEYVIMNFFDYVITLLCDFLSMFEYVHV